MFSKALYLLVALTVAGCAHRSQPPALEKPIRTLGVASNCGSIISRESLAWLNVGADDHTTRDSTGWGLDEALPQQLTEASNGRVQTIPVNADLLAIMQWRGESMFGGRTEADMLRAAIRQPTQSVDAYLLYTVGADGTPSGQRVNVRYGMGIFSRIRLNLAHVQCTAWLVDASSFKTIRRLRIGQTAEVDSGLLLDRWEEYSPQQMIQVQLILSKLWRKAVDDIVAQTPL